MLRVGQKARVGVSKTVMLLLNQYIQFEKYEITLDGNSLGVKDYVEDEYSAVVKADPCLHHVVRIKLKVGNAYHGQEK